MQSPRRALAYHFLTGTVAAAVVLALDVAARTPVVTHFTFLDAREYAAAFLGSVAMWWAFSVAASHFPRATLATTPVIAVLLFLQGAALVTTGQLPNDDAVRFLANQPGFLFRTAAQSSDPRALGLVLAALTLTGVTWAVALRQRVPRAAWVAAVFSALVTVAVGLTSRASMVSAITPEISALRVTGQLISWGTHPPPFFALPERRPPPTEKRALPFHVLWVIHETVGAQYLATPAGDVMTPGFLAVRNDPAVVWFARHHTVSSCTDLSVPAILTGLSPAAALEHHATARLPHALARAGGAFTFVSSAQSLAWASFDRWLAPEVSFDVFHSAEHFDPSAKDDLGVPDEFALTDALAQMDRAVAEGRRFMGLVRTNGTHGPYTADEPLALEADPGFGLGNTGGFVRYLNALQRLDRVTARFWEELARRPWFDDTLIISVADHGEAFDQHGILWHCGNFFPEESWVPAFVRLPAAWRSAHPDLEATLRSRAQATTFSSSLAPTVAAMLEWPELEAQADGDSLLQPGPPKPTLFTNCSDLRGCVNGDLGWFDGTTRWVWVGAERRWLAFDEAADPNALHALTGRTPALERVRCDARSGAVVRRVLGLGDDGCR